MPEEMDVNVLGMKNQTKTKKNVKAFKNNNKVKNSEILKFKKRFKGRLRPKGNGMIYLGRIPHGFYEDQMTAYFNQFGKVISAIVPRSKKSGRSKGYGFVEFEDEEVAKIAAEAMNNYLMFNKIIKCRYIPPDERKKTGFQLQNRITTCPRVINRITNAKRKRESLSKLSQSVYLEKTQHKISQFKQFFEERGIHFNFKINSNSMEIVNSSNDDSKKEEKDKLNEKDTIKQSEDIDGKMEDGFGVLEIDASDTEIHFRIPPQVKKIIKKSTNTSVMSSKSSVSQTEKNPKVKKSRKTNSKAAEKGKKLPITKQKNQNFEEKNKVNKKSPGEFFKTENRSSRKRNQTV